MLHHRHLAGALEQPPEGLVVAGQLDPQDPAHQPDVDGEPVCSRPVGLLVGLDLRGHRVGLRDNQLLQLRSIRRKPAGLVEGLRRPYVDAVDLQGKGAEVGEAAPPLSDDAEDGGLFGIVASDLTLLDSQFTSCRAALSTAPTCPVQSGRSRRTSSAARRPAG